MKVSREVLMELGKKMINYYQHTEPFERERLTIDVLRLSDPMRLYRVLCSCAYLGKNELFAGGTITKDILRVTGWKLPHPATALQIKQDGLMSEKLERKCRKYISKQLVSKIIKEQGLTLPVEWRIHYILYVPGNIFTSEELDFMKNNPCWLLPLGGNQPSMKEGEENDD